MRQKRSRKDWQMVRLQRSTVERLRQLHQLWMAARDRGAAVPDPTDRWEYSLDHIVRELLARDEAHRQRGRRPRRSVPAADQQ
jgi:hypothetical protein